MSTEQTPVVGPEQWLPHQENFVSVCCIVINSIIVRMASKVIRKVVSSAKAPAAIGAYR